ncbi:MAG: hypothetical protein ACRELZ_18475 [Candidatus Rokuibacteriota bacterium]
MPIALGRYRITLMSSGMNGAEESVTVVRTIPDAARIAPEQPRLVKAGAALAATA